MVKIKDSTLPEGAEQTAGTDPTAVNVVAGGTATGSDSYQLPATVANLRARVQGSRPVNSSESPTHREPTTAVPMTGAETPTEAPVTEPKFPTDF